MKRYEFESVAELDDHIQQGLLLHGAVFQGLDLRPYTEVLEAHGIEDALFLGCRLAEGLKPILEQQGNLVFPQLPYLPYAVYRGHLYTPEELMGAYRRGEPASYAETLDDRVYQHFLQTGKQRPASIYETLARRLHDHAMTDALEEFIAGKQVVGLMGGHSLGRDSQVYRDAAHLARVLTQKGFLMVSGGGPGAMEATHLGAWFAGRPAEALDQALAVLAASPQYKPKHAWLDTARDAQEKWPLIPMENGALPESLGVPTWLYGHEPPTVFATHIAKYFANSIREDGILTIARSGIIFVPGSAGTIQEVFQDATQNHYQVHDGFSPMIFFGETFWTKEKPVYPLMQHLATGHPYANWLRITDDPGEVVAIIESFQESGT